MKFKKIIAAILAVSAMSVTAMAKQVTPLPGGGNFVVYEEGDEIPHTVQTRASTSSSFTFNQTFPKYSSRSALKTPYTYGSQQNVILVYGNDRNILLHFNEDPSNCHVWLYNILTKSYELNGANMGSLASEDYGFTDLPASSVYRLSFSGTQYGAVTLSGTCEIY